jgi:hypothetical protein
MPQRLQLLFTNRHLPLASFFTQREPTRLMLFFVEPAGHPHPFFERLRLAMMILFPSHHLQPDAGLLEVILPFLLRQTVRQTLLPKWSTTFLRQPALLLPRLAAFRVAFFRPPVMRLPLQVVNLPFLPLPPPVYLHRFPRTRMTPNVMVPPQRFLRRLDLRRLPPVIRLPLQEQNLPFLLLPPPVYLHRFPRTRTTPRFAMAGSLQRFARLRHLLCLPRFRHLVLRALRAPPPPHFLKRPLLVRHLRAMAFPPGVAP